MADVRVINNVVISDPTTPSQIAAVDSSGRLSVSLTASSATVTVDSELPAAAALADATANPTTTTVGADNSVYNGTTWDRMRAASAGTDSTGTGIAAAALIGQLDDASTTAVTENQFAHVRISSRRALLIEGVASGTNVNVNLAASAATVTVDTELPAAGALGDATANPTTSVVGAFLEAFNGTTWDRVKTIDALDAAPNVRTGVLASGIGPGFDIKFNPSNLGTATNSAITNTVDGADEVTYQIGTSTSGTFTFEVSADDSTWVAAKFYNKQTGAVASGNITPTSGDVYGILVSGWRQVRIRTVSTLGATVAVKTTHALGTYGNDINLSLAITAADALANPTAVYQGVYLHGYNGATWDRLRSDTTNGLDVDVTRVSGTVTVDSELSAAAALADATANPTVTSVGVFLQGYNGTTWDRLRSSTANGLVVDVSRVQGTVTVDSELPAAAALADATSNPTVPGVGGFLMGYNGSTWDRVRTANTGRLQVDVVTGGGADTPTNPINNYQTNSAIAAGSTSNHDTADFGAATKKVSSIIMGASVAMKGELQYVDNGSGTTLAVFFTQAGMTQTFIPRHRNFWSHTFTANAGFDGFRLIRTNLDASEAADLYSLIQYED